MNQRVKLIIGIVTFILIVMGANYLLKMREMNTGNIDNAREGVKSDMIHSGEKVLEVTSDTFEKEVLQSNKKVLIDFYATWCGPCQVLSPIVEEVANEEDKVKFVKIDVDQNEKLASEYGIQYMPTLVVIEDGKEINRSIGLIEKGKIIELINK